MEMFVGVYLSIVRTAKGFSSKFEKISPDYSPLALDGKSMNNQNRQSESPLYKQIKMLKIIIQ